MINELDYMTARIYALSSQLHFFAGHTHPFYYYARKELYYFINELAAHSINHKGIKIARSIKRNLDNEDDELQTTKTFVACISPAQAYCMAQAAIKNDIELKTLLEIEQEDN